MTQQEIVRAVLAAAREAKDNNSAHALGLAAAICSGQHIVDVLGIPDVEAAADTLESQMTKLLAALPDEEFALIYSPAQPAMEATQASWSSSGCAASWQADIVNRLPNAVGIGEAGGEVTARGATALEAVNALLAKVIT